MVRFGFIDFLDLFCSCRYELILLNKTSYAPFAILFSVAIAFCKLDIDQVATCDINDLNAECSSILIGAAREVGFITDVELQPPKKTAN